MKFQIDQIENILYRKKGMPAIGTLFGVLAGGVLGYSLGSSGNNFGFNINFGKEAGLLFGVLGGGVGFFIRSKRKKVKIGGRMEQYQVQKRKLEEISLPE